MKITQEDFGSRGEFRAIEDGYKIGEMSYYWEDNNTLVINHTGVLAKYEGQGVGKQLVASAVEYARKNNKKIVPICQFAVAMFKRNPDFDDVKA